MVLRVYYSMYRDGQKGKALGWVNFPFGFGHPGQPFLNNPVERKTAIHEFWACLAHLLFNLEGLDAASAGEDDLVGVP